MTVIIILHLSDDKSIFRFKVVDQLNRCCGNLQLTEARGKQNGQNLHCFQSRDRSRISGKGFHMYKSGGSLC